MKAATSKASKAAAGAALAILLAGCGGGGGPAPDVGQEVRSSQARVTNPIVASDDWAALLAGNAAFAVDLYHATRGGSGNRVSAPVSVSLGWAMLHGGARGGTADEIAAGLHFMLPPERLHPAFDALDLALRASSQVTGGFQLLLANAAWGGMTETFLPEYLDLLAINYGAGMRVVDFVGDADGARRSINAWVLQQTGDKIPDLLAPGTIDALTALVLTNAVYFKADWEMPFNAPLFDGTFHAPSGDVPVKMMRAPEPSSFEIWTGAGFQAAALPYHGGSVSMVLVVPDAGTFDTFEAGLTTDGLAAIVAGHSAAQLGAVVMPGFAFAGEIDLQTVLQTMGVASVFMGGVADLSGINGVPGDLFVTSSVHKAIIAVDQKGTEAAAATAVVVGTRSAPPVTLAVDRPFLFFIRHDPTGTILFQGRVLDPTQ